MNYHAAGGDFRFPNLFLLLLNGNFGIRLVLLDPALLLNGGVPAFVEGVIRLLQNFLPGFGLQGAGRAESCSGPKRTVDCHFW